MSYDDEYKKVSELVSKRMFKEAAEIIRENLSKGFGEFAGKGRHVSIANYLVLAADWSAITSLLPKGTNFFLESGWLNSLFSGRPVNKNGDPIPWLTYPAIDFLDGRVQKNWRVFEWGSGNSTIWWSNRVASVHAVEDDSYWYEKCKNSYRENVTLKFAGSPEEYVNSIELNSEHLFDVVVIDGSHRNMCAEKALKHASSDGIIVFDNSDVPENEDGVRIITDSGWKRIDFFGLIPSYSYKNCTSVFFKNDEILTKSNLPSRVNFSAGLTCSLAMKR